MVDIAIACLLYQSFENPYLKKGNIKIIKPK